MPCELKRADVDALVLNAVRSKNAGDPNITFSTPFGENGLGEDGMARRRYFVPIREAMKQAGCKLKSMTANHMSKFNNKPILTVMDLADAVWSDRGSA